MKLLRVCALTMIVLFTGGWNHGAIRSGFIPVCDLVPCSEAYSVTRQMVRWYNGPLLQIYNGSTFLDIGQTTGHVADMTTWSAFCSGVQANCKITKIYGQINPLNTLVPASTNNIQFTCVGNTACAAIFAIEGTTSLPILNLPGLDGPGGSGPEYYIGPALGGNDAQVIGVSGQAPNSGPGPANKTSVVFSGVAIAQISSICCGVFGLTHSHAESNVFGTDFMAYFQQGVSGFNPCPGGASKYCAGAEQESVVDLADYGTSVKGNSILAVTYDPTITTVTATLNNSLLFSRSPPNGGADPLLPGAHIHLGGGGDMTQSTGANMREAVICNCALTRLQNIAIFNNVSTFYGQFGITFP